MHEELGYIHIVTKGVWDHKRSEKMKANEQKIASETNLLRKNTFLGKIFPLFPQSHLFPSQSTCKYVFRIVC